MHKTSWGGCWTLMIYMLSISALSIIGQEVIFHNKPNVVAIEQLEKDSTADIQNGLNNTEFYSSERASFSSSSMVFAIAAMDDSYQVISNWSQYFTITGQVIAQQGFTTKTILKELTFSSCNKLSALDKENFSSFSILDLQCISNVDQLSYYLTGELGSDVYTHILIQVKYKLPLSESKDIIQGKLANFGMFFTDQMMDVQRYSLPLSKYRKNIVQKVQLDTQYQTIIRNQHASIITDSGLIQSDLESKHYFFCKEQLTQHSELDENVLFQIRTETDPKLLVYNVNIDKKQSHLFFQIFCFLDILKRNYMKLTDLVGTIGGMIKSLLLIGFLIAHPVANLSLKTALINRLFKFEKKIEKDQEINSFNNLNKPSKCDDLSPQQALSFTKETHKISHITKNHYHIPSEAIPSSSLNSLNNSHNASINNANTTTPIVPQQFLFQFTQNGLPSPKKKSYRKIHAKNIIRLPMNKTQSMNDLSTALQSNKLTELQLNNHRHNTFTERDLKASSSKTSKTHHNCKKDKIKLVRTMLKSYANDHHTNDEDIMRASSFVGATTKEDPNLVFKKLFTSNEDVLDMKLWDYIKYFLGIKGQSKSKQIDYSMERVNERLNIVFIMKKLIEVDKLKMVFLNEDQRKIFEYLPKPIIKLDPEQQLQDKEVNNNHNLKHNSHDDLHNAWAQQMMNYKPNYISKASSAMQAYQHIIQKKQQINPIDQKLIDMLDDSKKLFFQAESPTLSLNKKYQNNDLSIIASVNHSPSKKQQVVDVEKELRSISPSDSIELQYQESNELWNANHQNPRKMREHHTEKLNQLGDNDRCFNSRNTSHFERHTTYHNSGTYDGHNQSELYMLRQEEHSPFQILSRNQERKVKNLDLNLLKQNNSINYTTYNTKNLIFQNSIESSSCNDLNQEDLNEKEQNEEQQQQQKLSSLQESPQLGTPQNSSNEIKKMEKNHVIELSQFYNKKSKNLFDKNKSMLLSAPSKIQNKDPQPIKLDNIPILFPSEKVPIKEKQLINRKPSLSLQTGAIQYGMMISETGLKEQSKTNGKQININDIEDSSNNSRNINNKNNVQDDSSMEIKRELNSNEGKLEESANINNDNENDSDFEKCPDPPEEKQKTDCVFQNNALHHFGEFQERQPSPSSTTKLTQRIFEFKNELQQEQTQQSSH